MKPPFSFLSMHIKPALHRLSSFNRIIIFITVLTIDLFPISVYQTGLNVIKSSIFTNALSFDFLFEWIIIFKERVFITY